jgi:hypothetical protein
MSFENIIIYLEIKSKYVGNFNRLCFDKLCIRFHALLTLRLVEE